MMPPDYLDESNARPLVFGIGAGLVISVGIWLLPDEIQPWIVMTTLLISAVGVLWMFIDIRRMMRRFDQQIDLFLMQLDDRPNEP